MKEMYFWSVVKIGQTNHTGTYPGAETIFSGSFAPDLRKLRLEDGVFEARIIDERRFNTKRSYERFCNALREKCKGDFVYFTFEPFN